MIITFSKKFAAAPSHQPLSKVVLETIDAQGARKYRGNVYGQITWATGRRVRFTLATRDAWAKGSRTAASGRHMRKASWEAHRDVLIALFDADPDARVQTGLATYRNRKHFHDTFESTAHRNVGSMIQPVTLRSTTVLP